MPSMSLNVAAQNNSVGGKIGVSNVGNATFSIAAPTFSVKVPEVKVAVP